MPTSRKRKPKKRSTGSHLRRVPPEGPPSIDAMIRAVLRGGPELLKRKDPLEVEQWASGMLGTFYKLPVPPLARMELEKELGPGMVKAALAGGDAPALAVLRALAAVADPLLGPDAAAAADRLAAAGVPEPAWALEIGKAECVDAWCLADPFGDQLGYYMTYRYPGRPRHSVVVLYDYNLGGIVKDAFAGYMQSDPRKRLESKGQVGLPVDIAEMAGRILQGVATGDMYIDNDWTADFKQTRALLVSRMSKLAPAPLEEPEPVGDKVRKALIKQFMASEHSKGHEDADLIADLCIDFAFADPLRWSPIVVEMFLMDFLPRKASLSLPQVNAVPEVLKGWVRFALVKRGLEDRWIDETIAAVDHFAGKFKRAATDPSSFGLAKSIANLLMSAGVDMSDPAAVQEWMDDFNGRPSEERDEILGPGPFDL